MKNFIMKVSLIIMAFTTMVTMNSCYDINNEIANDVCTTLTDKYGEDFVAVKAGDRFNTNSAKFYIHPANNESILFIARIDKDTGIVEDNYIEEKVNYQVENIIKEAFWDVGIFASSRCMVVTKDPIDFNNAEYTPKSFSEEYGFEHYTVYLILKSGEYSAVDILSAVKAINNLVDVKMVVAGYIFEEQMYSECALDIQEFPDIGITMIESKNPISSFDVNVDSGKCSISEADLSKKIGRS